MMVLSAMSLAAQLGENMRFLRETQGFSQEAFADLCGLHRTYLSGVERGTRNPTLAVIERIAKALEVPAADLFRKADKR